jgi:tRNA A37 threonylcarbamoyladenosine modification protein TsaB
MATSKPVVGIPTLDIIAHSLPLEGRVREGGVAYDEICVITDARREKLYACIYGPQGRKTDYVLTSLEDVLDKVHGRTLFTGDGLILYRKDIEEAYRKYASKTESGCKCLFADKKWCILKAR